MRTGQQKIIFLMGDSLLGTLNLTAWNRHGFIQCAVRPIKIQMDLLPRQ